MKIASQLQSASQALADKALPDSAPRLEAEILLAQVLDVPRSFLYAHPELELPSKRSHSFRQLLQRRLRGEPVAYLTGQREFWSLALKVHSDVLIPRPETEILVEAALQRIPGDQAARIADLGTGCGAIALAIASERPQAEVHGCDISGAAVQLARDNACSLGLNQVMFHQGSWCQPLQGQFDLLVSNPPYVAADDPHLQRGDCRFEPSLALSPGPDPLASFRVICKQAQGCLEDGGWLMFEHGFDQGQAVREILAEHGFCEVATCQDLEQRDRVSLGRRKP